MHTRWRALARRFRGRTGSPFLSRRPGSEDSGPLLDEEFLRLVQQLSLADVDALMQGLTGEHKGRSKTQAIEFNDYRSYAPGDDFRQIDWNVYARLGELFVKTSLAEENIALSLLVDCSRSMNWGRPNKLRYAKRLAAALGAIALLHYDTVRVYAVGDGRGIPGTHLRGQDSLPFLVRELETIPLASTTDLVGGIEEYRRVSEQQGTAVLLSDLLVPEQQENALAYLADDRVRASVLHIVDAAEAAPPLRGSVELRDLETGHRIEMVVTPALRRRYMARFEKRSEELAARCAAQQIGYIRVPTEISPSDLVLDTLRHEGLVKS